MPDPAAFVFGTFDGPVLDVMGGRLRVLFDGEQTGGQHSCVSAEYPPGTMVPPHSHGTTDELFYIAEGGFEFWVDGAWKAVPTRSTIYAQRGVMHGFRNVGTTTGLLVATYNPAGFEKILVEMDALARAGKFTEAALQEISERYGVLPDPDFDPAKD